MSDDDWGDSPSVSAAPPPQMEGRGRGRGGGGPPGNCFKCKQPGHMSRDCPNVDADEVPRKRACHKCGDESHMARECPNNTGGGGGGGGRGCFKCGEEGHMSRDCPNNAGGGGGGGGRGCFKCGEEGHMSRDCPSNAGGGGGGGGGGRGCFKCGEEGHMSRDCPNNAGGGGGGGGGGRGNGCFKCGEEGHMSRDCPNNAEGDGGGRRKGCFNCGEEGHMSRDCTNERREDVDRPPRKDGAGEDDPTKENYTPPEMPEGEQIFEERKAMYDSSGINFKAYDNIAFEITGNNKVPSISTFKELGLSNLILKNLEKCGYENPTPIQKHGSPQLNAGTHVMCCAQTGSGKTAAFLLPIIQNLLKDEGTRGLSPAFTSPAKPEALVLAPTRELAIQIAKEANMYANDSMIRTQIVYGGAAIPAQKARLSRGCNILVATTGRLKQFVKENIVDLSNVRYFILDEADRMLDMGFMPDVEEIVQKLPPKEDIVAGMFSATFPEAIRGAANKFLHDYVFVVIGMVGGACKEVKQEFREIEKAKKKEEIVDILKQEGKTTKVVIFCASKKGADFLATHLSNKQISVTSIHGDRLQSQRETALREFSSGLRQVLVATAVAARGLDIPKVGLVINYDLPSEIDEYVHRIGRTGRVGRQGKAISFYDPGQDGTLSSGLVSILKEAGQPIPAFLTGTTNGYGGDDGFQATAMGGAQGSAGGAKAAAAEEDEEW